MKNKFSLIVILFLFFASLSCQTKETPEKPKKNPDSTTTVSPSVVKVDEKDRIARLPNHYRLVSFNCQWMFHAYFAEGADHDYKRKRATEEIKKNWPKTKGDYLEKLTKVAEALVTAQGDFYALQEIEDDHVLADLAEILSKNLNKEFKVYFVPGEDKYTFQNVGVITHLPVVEYRRLSPFPQTKVSKHLAVKIRIQEEEIWIVDVHLKAGRRPADLEQRKNQGLALHGKLRDWIRTRENVIVMGDFNTGSTYGNSGKHNDSEYFIGGKETSATDDDLDDLHQNLPAAERGTHGKSQLDRILVSRPLKEDDPSKRDLVFSKMGRFIPKKGTSDHNLIYADFEVK